MEYSFCWKKTFDGRQPLMGDNIWGKTTFHGRRALLAKDIQRTYRQTWGATNFIQLPSWLITKLVLVELKQAQ